MLTAMFGANEVLAQLIEASLHAALAIVVILGVRQLFGRRLPALFTHALWAIVLVRLLIPIDMPAPISLYNALNPLPTVTVATGSPLASATAATTPTKITISGRLLIGAAGRTAERILRPAAQATPVAPSPYARYLPALIWLIGMAVLGLYGLATSVALRQRLRFAVRLPDDDSDVLCRRLGITRPPSLWASDVFATPVVWGVLHPRVILPAAMDLSDDTMRESILIHELIHVRRRDVAFRTLASVALVIHWFNPLAWLAFAISRRDMERACDEGTVAELGKAKTYASTLLRLSELRGRRPMPGGVLSFGEGDIKGRIRAVLSFRVWNRRLVATAILLLVALSATLLTSRQSRSPAVFANGAGGAGSFDVIPIAASPKVVWSSILPSKGTTGLVVADGRAFVGLTGGRLIAYDLGTGDLIWTYDGSTLPYGDTVTIDGVARNTVFIRYASAPDKVVGVRTTTGHRVRLTTGLNQSQGFFTVEEGGVAYQCTPGGLSASEVTTGQTRWTASLPSGIEPGYRPTVHDGLVYVSARHEPTIGGGGESQFSSWHLYAFDAASGARKWELEFPLELIDLASPQVGDGSVVVQGMWWDGVGSQWLQGAYSTETGARLWERVLPVRYIPLSENHGSVVGSTLFTNSRLADSTVQAIEMATGKEIWTINTREGSHSGYVLWLMPVDGGLVVVTEDGWIKLLR